MDSDDELVATCEESVSVKHSKEEISDVSLEHKINDLLCKHDGNGSFSTLAFITISLGISSTAFYAYSMCYLELKPSYLCNVIDSTMRYDCTPADFCGKDNEIEYRVDWGSPFSLHNWIEKLDATCIPGI